MSNGRYKRVSFGVGYKEWWYSG